MKKRNFLIASLSLIILLGGCQKMTKMNEAQKKYTKAEIITDGKIDVEKAKASGYVTMAEKEKIGYYTENTSSNKKVQKEALEKKDEIYNKMKPMIEKSIGRKIEILGLSSPFPYPSVDVDYVTIDEPYVSSFWTIGLEDSSYFEKDSVRDNSGDNKEVGSPIIVDTVNGLYRMVFKDEIQEMEDYFLTKYPQYQKGGQNLLMGDSINSSIISIRIAYPVGQETEIKRMDMVSKKIYDMYKENPNRSNEEWRTTFNQEDLYYAVAVNVILKDSTINPEDKDLKELMEELKNQDKYKTYLSYLVIAKSNLIDTNSNLHLTSISLREENENVGEENE